MLFIVSGSYLNLWEFYVLEQDSRVILAVAYVSKGILFVVMRYVSIFKNQSISN